MYWCARRSPWLNARLSDSCAIGSALDGRCSSRGCCSSWTLGFGRSYLILFWLGGRHGLTRSIALVALHSIGIGMCCAKSGLRCSNRIRKKSMLDAHLDQDQFPTLTCGDSER